jgi:hypothetical protein
MISHYLHVDIVEDNLCNSIMCLGHDLDNLGKYGGPKLRKNMEFQIFKLC